MRLDEYLQPTTLCDFDRAPTIVAVASDAASGGADRAAKLDALYRFVKELPYAYEDWYIKASETLRKKAGMCSGKTNLFVAMCRSIGIPARYRVFKVEAQLDLFRWLGSQDAQIARMMGQPYQEQDHVLAEVWVNGGWQGCDTSIDTPFELGLKELSVDAPITPISVPGIPKPLLLASFDDWVRNVKGIGTLTMPTAQCFLPLRTSS